MARRTCWFLPLLALSLFEPSWEVPLSKFDKPSPTVQTNKGKVRGLRKSYNGELFDVFRGIPFATPPVGSLRWERPREPTAWDDVFQAVNFSIACTQIIREVSGEDCLYLNVYVPNGVGNVKSLPVMVFAHGGGFLFGAGDIFHSEELALIGQVVVVTFNYRLSALGGLATGDGVSPGNYHLWDARAVLLWIKANIQNFGGDPTRVTAFGQSAGAVVTSHLAISPLTKDLVHRVIDMSGNAASTVGIQYKSLRNAINLALEENCPVANTRQLVQCLRGKDAHDVDLSGLLSMVLEGGTIPSWLPAVDGAMVPDIPADAWRKGAGSDVDLITGRAHDDAAGFVYLNLRGEPRNITLNLAADKELLDIILKFLVQSYAPEGKLQVLLDTIKGKYPDIDSDDELTRTKAVSQAVTDFIWSGPSHFEATSHSRNSKSTGKKTFQFDFKYRASFLHHPSWVTASHTDYLHFVFGEPYRRDLRRERLGPFSPLDTQVKINTMRYFANFAHTGDPSKGPHKVPTEWPQYDPVGKQYLQMDADMVARKEDPQLLSRINFWLNEWPKITVPESP